MKQTKNQIVTVMALVWISSIGLCAEPFAKGPYLGQTPPGPIAKVFAPGLICRAGPQQGEGNVSFSADGHTFCFGRLGHVYITENTNQGWTTPQRIEGIPRGAWSPCLSPDANSIYYMDQHSKPWTYHRCLRTSQGWSLPRELGPPFSSARGGFSVSADNSIYFKSKRGGFWISPFVDNTWSEARKIPIEMGNLLGCHPGVAPDGSFLVFYSIRPGAIPGTETDLYLTLRRADGTWTKPRNMGPGINTGYHEIAARISPDKKYMFFIRMNGWLGGSSSHTSDIYWVELKEYLTESYRSPEGIVNGQKGPMKRRSVMKQMTEIGSIQAPAEPIAKGPYLGQSPPGSTAQVFAPGLICDTRPHQWESWVSFSTDGNTFCFNRLGLVYITENTEQGWTTPKKIISVPYRAVSCCLSPDANGIYFMNRKEPSRLYRCQRTPDGWSEQQELGPTFNYSGAYAGFSLAANNSIYLFHSKPRAGVNGGGIFYAPYVNNTWPRLIKLPLVGTFPGIAPDESFMVFTTIRPEALSGTETDLYLTLRRPDGTWTKPRNMGPKINSGYFEFGARISPDKKYMFFTRSNGWLENPYHDTSDIYWVELKEYLPESHR
jgi:hypothetical protein